MLSEYHPVREVSHALARVAIEKGSVDPISAPSPVVVRLMVPTREVPLNVGGIHEGKPVVVAVAWQHVDHRVRLDKPLSPWRRRPTTDIGRPDPSRSDEASVGSSSSCPSLKWG